MLRTLILSSLATVAMTAMIGGPVVAAGKVIDCPNLQGELETGNFTFKPLLFGYDGHETDDGGEFEFRFVYDVTVTTYDEANPDVPGVQVCKNNSAWKQNSPILSIKNEFNPVRLDYPIVVNNVPRHSKIHVIFYASEEDAFKDDKADFDPHPLGSGAVEFDVFVNSHTGHTMVGWRTGKKDLVLGSVKRLVGDGETGWSSSVDEFRAFLEFTAQIVANPPRPPGAATLAPNLPSVGTPLNPGPGTPTPNKEPLCRNYALKAVEFNQQALALNCGFSPPVWSNNHQMHFDWCMHGNNSTSAGGENTKRAQQVAACKAKQAATPPPPPAPSPTPPSNAAQFCQSYAQGAIDQYHNAVQRNCVLFGPEWSPNYNQHYNWCVQMYNSGQSQVVMAGSAKRAQMLAGCP